VTLHPIADVRLNVEELGPRRPGSPPLLLLHGFTGSAESWRTIDWERPAIAVDLIGHGSSDKPTDPSCYRAEAQVAQLLELLNRLEPAQVDLLGYSMGGRVALQLAVAAPERVRNLVLESASPGIVDPEERAGRVESDEKLAAFAEREGIEAFVNGWERVPLFASQGGLPDQVRARLREQRLRNDARALAASLRGFGAGVPDPLWDRLPRHRTLILVGALDEKYRALGRAMAERMPDARLEVVPDAGHTIHLEQPAAFARLVIEFLGD
jgi:2-succinyl-6-hydroxy-2,4-cyclohexadiene-1-carboxylate synthase